MKRELVTLVSIAFMSTMLVAAQSAPVRTNQAAPGVRAPSTVIVTGCVDDGGESGAYMLTRAEMRSTPKGRPTPAPDSGTVGIKYTLLGPELQAHVGHKVEVTGLLDPTSKKGRAKSSAKDQATATIQAMNGTLTVQTLKMISPTCP